MPFHHIPVMPDKVIHYLNARPGGIYVDGTLGGSGHARAILSKILPDGKLIGIDQDAAAIRHAEKVFDPFRKNIHLFNDNFVHLPEILDRLKIGAADGVILDLGLSLHQLEASGRGFSFQKDEPLDMRMNTANRWTAGELVNQSSETQLCELFRRYGEERWARRIARKIVSARRTGPVRSSRRLSEIVRDAVPEKRRHDLRIHPATRVFMALRIAVNRELECLERFMGFVPDILETGGRLCVISFHSLEDRIVKHGIRKWASPCQCPPDLPACTCGKKAAMAVVTKRAITPSDGEIAGNPRARSAKMRVAEKR